ncbi:MAG TPA: hypothetical protein PK765_07170 [bacterium]|mgnify:CR=1 FL=1|nr:hypothetical protein [bacterium]
MKTTLVTVTAGAVALSMLAAASSFASMDSAVQTVTDTASSVQQAFQGFGEGRGHGPRGDGEGVKFNENVTRIVSVLENGFVMEVTSDDADTIAKIQEREADAPKGPNDENVTRTIENTASGVKVTVTSDDADTAAKLVEMGTNMKDGKMLGRGGGRGHGPHGGGMMDMGMSDESVIRVITTLENGYTMTVTSDDADTAAKLVAQAARLQERETRMKEMQSKMQTEVSTGTTAE